MRQPPPRRQAEMATGDLDSTRARVRSRQALTNARKRQQICFLLVSFYFLFISFYFLESGLFNRLRAREIKKSSRALGLAVKLWSVTMSNSHEPLRARPPAGDVDSCNGNLCNACFWFCQEKAALLWRWVLAAPEPSESPGPASAPRARENRSRSPHSPGSRARKTAAHSRVRSGAAGPARPRGAGPAPPRSP